MKCPCCGAAELIRDTRDIPYSYKGKNTVVAAVTGDYCPSCHEVILEKENGDRMAREMQLFSAKVDAAKEHL